MKYMCESLNGLWLWADCLTMCQVPTKHLFKVCDLVFTSGRENHSVHPVREEHKDVPQVTLIQD